MNSHITLIKYNLINMTIPFSKICSFIKTTCHRYNIDESHGMKHALDVYKYSRNLVSSECENVPHLLQQKSVIYTSALLHDTCDKKYMDESEGILNIHLFLNSTQCYSKVETDIILKIIQTMSYSKVKVNGFPTLGIYQKAYHIVREADLLTAYDFDRGLLYTMNNYKIEYKIAFALANDLYQQRMAKHIEHGLITTKYGMEEGKRLLIENQEHIASIKDMLEHDV